MHIPSDMPSRRPPEAEPPRVQDPWRERLLLMLESAGQGIFGVDMHGRCVFINRAGAALLGYAPEDILQRNMHHLIHHTHPDGRHYPEEDCPIFNAFRRGLPCHIDSEVLWRKDGRPFEAEYSSHPILEHRSDGPVILGAVVTFVDISERKRAEASLRRSHDELEQRVAERTVALSDALQRLRELSAYLESVREQERTRIAREIHDELGSLLVALKMDVNWLARRVGDAPALVQKCQGMGGVIDRAVDNLGRIITDLRPSILDHQGLWAALEWQAQEVESACELHCDLQAHVTHGVVLPDGEAGERWAIAVFRIFQELLSNVARHARATRVTIRLQVDAPPDPVLHLELRDDGIGADAAALAGARAWGVMGMRERAAHFGGELRIEGMPGRGTRARLTMPLPRSARRTP